MNWSEIVDDRGEYILVLVDLIICFYLEYQMCINQARTIRRVDKSLFCPNFYYVFYAELEINLNRYFPDNSVEQWSLLFVDDNFIPLVKIDPFKQYQTFYSQPNLLMILHNAKIKYRCLDCHHEWTTAQGRAIFQAETPQMDKHNVLFAYLFTQKCRLCHHETKPSWYLDEATRVMKNVSRILIEQFYSQRQLATSPSPSSSSSEFHEEIEEEEEERSNQRTSHMKHHHYYHLCQACLEGSCYASGWQCR